MEHLKKIKCKIVNCVYEELEHNLESINIAELGEAIDMIKDLEKAIYYETVIKAMEEEPHKMKVKSLSDAEDIEANKKDHSE